MDVNQFLPTLPFTDPVLIFFVVLTIILFAPLLLNKLRIPHIIGLILAGTLFGPHGLDVLAHDFKKFTLLGQQVDAALAKQARSNEQKAAMRKAVGGVVQQVILPTMCEGNQFDPKYAEYKKLAMEIFDKELKDL